MKKNKHIGSDFDDFLREDGALDHTEAVAIKRVIAHELSEAMKEKRLTKSAMANQMHTSRSALDRLFDPSNEAVTLHTLLRAATVLGKRLKVEFC